ncbi:hypothetical protein G3I59_40195 [Amycolatopsis rubida]|uniref:DUF6801 domain-containing protein n=1 Tax=Amycolatopsis rubida TaxID=112413 RepID=A0ABX0C1H3_9PSEU|nr:MULTISPECIES: DUF6801 domain-containing protein [Amycolatopsis]MYW96669.1 hypothetical protein [Amycolatopsis rubida]NEC61654.1 hypothetical protein [Amycolatopsis rubida]OAP24754.1 hypothetical protein A4R44_04267 [Amycolatopsis sp. M39]
MPRSRGRSARRRPAFAALAILGALSIGTGALTGVSSASTETPTPTPPPPLSAGEQQVNKDVVLDCPFAAPAGPQQITLTASATVPATVQVGSGLKFRSLTASFALPRAVADQLAPAPADSIRGGLTLDLTARQGSKSTAIPVPFTIAETPLPPTGDVRLTATADLPEQAITVPGKVSFDIGAPAIAVKPAADGATGPAPVACTLLPDQTTTLASVIATGAPTAVPRPDKPDTPPAPPPPAARPDAVSPKADPDFPLITPLNYIQVAATSSVYRLGATVASSPTGVLNGTWTIMLVPPDYVQHDPSTISGTVGFRPTAATFLGFGFVPVTATVEFLPVDYHHTKLIEFNGKLVLTGDFLTTHIQVMARMSNAKVNGVPLDLGPDCVTAKPISLNLSGKYKATTGGILSTDPNSPDPDYRGFALPPFVHCGTAEPLSPLLTGMASTTTNVNQAKVVNVNFAECASTKYPDHTKCPPIPDTPFPQ